MEIHSNTTYKTYIPELIEALQTEIDQSKNQKSHTQDMEDGLLVDTQVSGGQTLFLYSFTTDSEVQIPEDTSASMIYQDKTYDVTIISIIEYTLLLSVTENLGNEIYYARLSTEPWFLLIELQKRLQTLAASSEANEWAGILFIEEPTNTVPPAISEAYSLLSSLYSQDDKADEEAQTQSQPASRNRIASLAGERRIFDAGMEIQIANAVEQKLVYNEHQLQAVGHILSNKTSYIWGPPGTGKSRTLGMAAAALFARGESVLILAHSNAAVDVAMANVAHHLKHTAAYRNGQIIRYGPTASSIIQEQHPQILARHILQDKYPELVGELDRVEKRLQQQMKMLRMNNASSQQKRLANININTLRQQRAELYQQLGGKEKLLVTQASIVGCTLSKATISPVIYDLRSFDAVLVDEASMAYIPHCLFAAGWLATQRVAFFGDFRQLAPISQADNRVAKIWLQRDIYEMAGIRQKLEAIAQAKKSPTQENRSLRAALPEEVDPRLVMLRIQYRMHPDIAAVPNSLYYYDLLQNAPTTYLKTMPTVAAQPFPGNAVAVINTALLGIYCFSDYISMSRFNPVSALLTVIQARQAIDSGQVVGIVTPYNAQARLINRIMRESNVPRDYMLVATVHKFQGSERDLMLFDLVEGQGKQPSLLFSGSGSSVARLTNVAISRARGKFIYLHDKKYVKKYFPHTHELSQFTNMILQQAISDKGSGLLNAQWPSVNVHHGVWHEGELPSVHCYVQSREQSEMLSKHLMQAEQEIAISWPDIAVKESDHFRAAALLHADQNGVSVHLSGKGAHQVITHLAHGYRYSRKNSTHAWYKIGIVCVDRHDMWLYLQPELAHGTILHIALPKTVSLLREMFDLVPSEKWRQISLADKTISPRQSFSSKTTIVSAQSVNTPPLSTTVACDETLCPQCRAPLWIKLNRSNWPSIVCTNPACHYRQQATVATLSQIILPQLNVHCDDCGAPAAIRQGKRGFFWGCSNYPNCRWTKRIDW